MGHYDSCYEADAKSAREEKTSNAKEASKEFDKYSKGHIRALNIPQRIQDAMDEIRDWLVIQTLR